MTAQVTRLRGLLRNFFSSPDDEHEMSLNRLIAGLGGLIFVLLSGNPHLDSDLGLTACAVFLSLTVGIAVHIAARPQVTHVRRLIAMVTDISGCALQLHFGGSQAAWVFPVFLWIIIGNGARFGQRLLLSAMGLSIVAFAAVLATTPFWWQQISVSVGVLIGLVIIPPYTFVLLNKLRRARQLAVESSQVKSLFLAKVSHELRTPLNAIIGFGALLSDGRLDRDQREMAQTILSSGRDLLSLIDGILDLARLESGRMPINDVDFQLDDVLDDVRRSVLVQAQQKGLRVGVFIASGTPMSLRADIWRLREILLNLLGNAVKFTPHGVVVVSAEAVASDAEVNVIRFQVDDTGIGIPVGAQARVFEMFTQADDTIANRYGGTGLGLSITRQLVDLLGGQVSMHSKVGSGTTVTVELPLRLSAPREPLFAAHGIRCFLVSDPDELSGGVVVTLRSLGASVENTDGTQATRSIQRGWRSSAHAPVPAVIAVAQSSHNSPEFSYAFLLHAQALRLFAVTSSPVTATREERRSISTVITADASSDAVLQALRICREGRDLPDARHHEEAAAVEPLGFTVLIAEDNRMNQKVMTRILERAGYAVAIANDGEEMLDRLEQGDIDLVVADVNMPNMGGIEATQLYRVVSSQRPFVPIIGVTADVSDDTRKRCISAGMTSCLHKPVEPSALVSLVADVLSEYRPKQKLAGPEVSPASNTELVRSIASHPRFRVVTTPTVNLSILEGLRDLGGDAFVIEIINDFTTETDTLLHALRTAVDEGDLQAATPVIHALRSSAVNIGGEVASEMLNAWNDISADQLRRDGKSRLADLVSEMFNLRRSLASFKASLEGRQQGTPQA